MVRGHDAVQGGTFGYSAGSQLYMRMLIALRTKHCFAAAWILLRAVRGLSI